MEIADIATGGRECGTVWAVGSVSYELSSQGRDLKEYLGGLSVDVANIKGLGLTQRLNKCHFLL